MAMPKLKHAKAEVLSKANAYNATPAVHKMLRSLAELENLPKSLTPIQILRALTPLGRHYESAKSANPRVTIGRNAEGYVIAVADRGRNARIVANKSSGLAHTQDQGWYRPIKAMTAMIADKMAARQLRDDEAAAKEAAAAVKIEQCEFGGLVATTAHGIQVVDSSPRGVSDPVTTISLTSLNNFAVPATVKSMIGGGEIPNIKTVLENSGLPFSQIEAPLIAELPMQGSDGKPVHDHNGKIVFAPQFVDADGRLLPRGVGMVFAPIDKWDVRAAPDTVIGALVHQGVFNERTGQIMLDAHENLSAARRPVRREFQAAAAQRPAT
jgi:hypothetical protein